MGLGWGKSVSLPLKPSPPCSRLSILCTVAPQDIATGWVTGSKALLQGDDTRCAKSSREACRACEHPGPSTVLISVLRAPRMCWTGGVSEQEAEL